MSGTVTSAENKNEEPVVTPMEEPTPTSKPDVSPDTPEVPSTSGEGETTPPTTTPSTPPVVTPTNDGSQEKDDSSLIDDMVYAKNYIIQHMTAPKLIGGAITAAALGSELGKKKSLPRALVTAGGTALGGYLGKNLYEHFVNAANTAPYFDKLNKKIDGVFNANVSQYLPYAAGLLGAGTGYMLSKSGSAAGATFKYIIPASIGVGVSHGLFNKEHTSDESKIVNMLIGAGSALVFRKNPAGALAGFATIPLKDMAVDAHSTGLIKNLSNAAKAIGDSPEILPKAVEAIQSSVQNQVQNTNHVNEEANYLQKLLTYGGLGLGVSALGIGGYALYDYLRSKRNKQPVVRVNLEGDKDDPYDNAVVELPLNDVNVSEKLTRGVNRSLKDIIRENNKFSTRKKDPYTGELIPYKDYVDKYGEPS